MIVSLKLTVAVFPLPVADARTWNVPGIGPAVRVLEVASPFASEVRTTELANVAVAKVVSATYWNVTGTPETGFPAAFLTVTDNGLR